MTNAKGFTTTELIVASLFAVVVLGTLYSFYRGQLYNLLSQETKTATLQDARGALDLMVRELRNAGAWTSGTQPSGCQRLVTATASSLRIQADLDGWEDPDDPNKVNCTSATGEDIRYDFANPTSTCPATSTGKIIRRWASAIDTGPCLVDDVSASDLFTYYAAGSSVPLAQPISDLDAIKRVKITFAVQLPNPNPNASAAVPTLSTTLSSSVEFRN